MAPRGGRRPGDRKQRGRRHVQKTPPAASRRTGRRVLLLLMVLSLIALALAIAGRNR